MYVIIMIIYHENIAWCLSESNNQHAMLYLNKEGTISIKKKIQEIIFKTYVSIFGNSLASPYIYGAMFMQQNQEKNFNIYVTVTVSLLS